MNDATTLTGAALLKYVEADLLRLYANAPAFGSLTFTVHLHEGRPVRLSSGAEISKQARP